MELAVPCFVRSDLLRHTYSCAFYLWICFDILTQTISKLYMIMCIKLRSVVVGVTDQQGVWIIWQVSVGIRESQGHRDTVQVVQQDPGKDIKIGDDKQGHGEEGVPAGGPHGHTLVHAGSRPHQRPLDHLPHQTLATTLHLCPASFLCASLIHGY